MATIRESIVNFLYAVTNANELVRKADQVMALDTANCRLLEERTRNAEEIKRVRHCMQQALKTFVPENLSKEEAENLYFAVQDLDNKGILRKESIEANLRFGFIRDVGADAADELKRITYINALVGLGVLPAEHKILHLEEGTRQLVRAGLGANELPRDMPVGQIDYLSLSGEVSSTTVFSDASLFLEQIKESNFYGEPMCITVFQDPATGKHIDTAWLETLDPVPQGFKLSPYEKEPKDVSQEPFLFSSVKDCRITDLMRRTADNAWSGTEPSTIYIHAGDDVITINGYVYEPGYEYFSSTASISLNGQVLYGIDSRSVDAYKNETYHFGIYKTPEEAIAHIEKQVKGQAFLVESSSALKEQTAPSLDTLVKAAEDKKNTGHISSIQTQHQAER